MKTLLDNNADVNASAETGSTPLHIDSHSGHTGVVKLLLDHKADMNAICTSNYASLQKNHIKVVKVLLAQNFDMNTKSRSDRATHLHIAVVNARTSTNDIMPLYIASEKRHIEIVKLLLDHKADVNACTQRRTTPLCIAVLKGQTGTEIAAALRSSCLCCT